MLTSGAETDTATAGHLKLLTLHHLRRAAPNGFSSAPQVEERIAAVRAAGVDEPEGMLSAVAKEFETYALGSLSFEDE